MATYTVYQARSGSYSDKWNSLHLDVACGWLNRAKRIETSVQNIEGRSRPTPYGVCPSCWANRSNPS